MSLVDLRGRKSELEVASLAASIARTTMMSLVGWKHDAARPGRGTRYLAIAATANVHGVPLLTRNGKDFTIIGDLVELYG